MSRLKNVRNINVDKAEARMSGMRAIDPNLDLGDDFTVAVFESKLKKFHILQDDHNTTLSKVDELYNAIHEMEKEVNDFSSRMLAGVLRKYGSDSPEYEQAGGTMKRKIKRKASIKKTA
jgi:hypothetical protein